MGRSAIEVASAGVRLELQRAGLRATPARIDVLSAMRTAQRPLSHQEVCDRLAEKPWDPTTVYRNLLALVEAGFLQRSDLGDHTWRFEAPKGDPTEGATFVCVECGSTEALDDVDLRLPARRQVPASVRRRKVQIKLAGVCDDCEHPDEG